MNVPLLQRETHVLNLCSDHVDQSFLLFATYVRSTYIPEHEDFRNEFARGDRAEEAMLAAMETTIGEQTNHK